MKSHEVAAVESADTKRKASASVRTGQKRKAEAPAVASSQTKGHSYLTEASEGSGASGGHCRLPRGSEDLLFDARPQDRPVGEDTHPWTCPACDLTLRTASLKKLGTKVWNHWTQRHPGQKMPPESAPKRQQHTPVVATKEIPQNQRDWECPVCHVGLPSLPRALKSISIEHHRATCHPRISRKRMYAKRWDDWESVEYLRAGKKRQSDYMKRAADERTPASAFRGHRVIRLHLPEIYGKSRHFTCSVCRLRNHAKTAFTQQPCSGAPVKVTAASRTWWARHRDKGVEPLLEAWGIGKTEADRYFQLTDPKPPPDDVPVMPAEQTLGHDLRYVHLGAQRAEGQKFCKVLTCLRCRFIRPGASRLSQCRGSEAPPHPLQSQYWGSGQLAFKKVMCEAWGCTVREANCFFRPPKQVQKEQTVAAKKGTKVGQAKNPGPRSEACLARPARAFGTVLPVLVPKGVRRRLSRSLLTKEPRCTNRLQLKAAWRAVRVGEATNPGPSRHGALRQLSFRSVNVGGAACAWSAMRDAATDRIDVLALQEPLMSSTEARSFIASARKLGYAAYIQPGKPTVGRWGEERQWAGAALLVHAELKSRVHVKLDSLGGQAVLLWVGGLLFGSCYAAQTDEVDEFLTELATEVAALGPGALGACRRLEPDGSRKLSPGRFTEMPCWCPESL